MTMPTPVQRARERLDQNLEDALSDLAWLSRIYAGGQLGEQMTNLHGHITTMRETMAREAGTDEQQS